MTEQEQQYVRQLEQAVLEAEYVMATGTQHGARTTSTTLS